MSDNLIGATTAIFIVSLSIAVNEPVDVAWSTRDGTAKAGTDYQAANGVVTFLPGETEKQIEVIVYGQNVSPTGDKNFFINLMPPTNAVLGTALIEAVIKVEDEAGVPVTSVIVAQGKRGLRGEPGLSAYEQAVLMGYDGTVEEWMQEQADAAAAAQRASDYAASAAAAATKAESAATSASFLGNIFPTPEAGVDPVTGVGNGAYYNVRSPSDDSYLVEYQNIGGVPTPSGKSYPSAALVDQIRDAIIDEATGEATAEKLFDGDKNQKQINELNSYYTLNVVNVLEFIPKHQHALIENGQVGLQDQTLVTAGLNAASAYAKTLKLVKFVVPPGEYATNDTFMIDLPSGSHIEFDGYIATSVIAKPAVVIGSYDTNRFYYKISDIAAYHRDVNASITGDPDRLGAGVLLLNIVACTGNIKRARGFSHGVWMVGSQSNGGCSYNHITLGFLKENVYPIRLTMLDGGGYCNENTFYGGSMGHGSGFPYTGDEVDIKIDGGIGNQQINNNLFFRPSLESNNIDTKAAVIDGSHNQIYMPRIENSQNYGSFTFEFKDTSDSCSVFGGGFGLKNANIVDNGVNNKYQNSSTFFWSGDTSVASGRAAFEIKNTATNIGKALRILNTSNVETFRVLGSGTIYSAGNGYFENGLRWRSNDSSYTDRGLFLSTASPEGVTTASPGSICVQTSNSKVFVKKSGAGNTGWRELVELIAGSTAQRPTVGLSAGISYFDTTLNKPIWYNGTVWVDATGATV